MSMDKAGMERYGQIDLHLHLDGSLSAETILKLAQREHMPLPADTREGLRPYLTAAADCKNLNEYLKCFDLPLAVLQTADNLNLAAYELGKDLAKKGLRYAEIRFAPQFHRKNGLTQEEAVRAVLAGLHKAEKETLAEKCRGVDQGFSLRVILCCMRGNDSHEANMETVSLASRYLGRGVAAADLAGAEALYPTQDYEEEFRYAESLGVPFTIHAGEAAGPDSIWTALKFGAVRIGHGVRAAEDKALLKELAKRGTVLEMCPSSNLQTKAAPQLSDYPLREYLEKGINVTVNSDNMTVSDTWVGKEFALLSREYGLTEEEAGKLLLNARKAAFEYSI